jgi:hypothetical protein
MRKNGRIAIWTGVGLSAAGALLGFLMLILQRYQLVPVAVALISGGPSLIAVALGAKAWQAQAESRNFVASAGGPPSPPLGA